MREVFKLHKRFAILTVDLKRGAYHYKAPNFQTAAEFEDKVVNKLN
jgi:hypothetical protein